MKSKTAFICLILTLSVILPCFAKTVKIKLLDGTEVTGTVVKEYKSKVVIRTIAGQQVISRSEIKSMVEFETARQKYEKLLKEKDLKKAEDHLFLAKWCIKNNMKTEYYMHLNKVVAIDPDNEAAQVALGRVRYLKKWVENDKVKEKIIWITKKQKIALEEEELRRTKKMKDGKQPKGEEKRTVILNLPEHEPLTQDERNFIMRFISDLGSSSWRTRSKAINTLCAQEFSHKIPPLLVDVLQKGSSNAKVSALEALIKMKYSYVTALCEQLALNDQNPEVKIKAMFYLGRFGDTSSAKVLLKLLDHKDLQVVQEAIAGLEKISCMTFDYLGKPDISKAKAMFRSWYNKNAGSSRKQILKNVIHTGQPMDQIKAAQLLYELGEIEALFALAKLLDHKLQQVQVEANLKLKELTGEDFQFDAYCTSESLKKKWMANWEWHINKMIKDSKTVAPKEGKGTVQTMASQDLIKALGHENDAVRETARKQIMAMDKPDSIPMLLRALNNKDFFVRARALALLQTVTEQLDEMGYDPNEEKEDIRLVFVKKWQEWYDKNKSKFESKPKEEEQPEE